QLVSISICIIRNVLWRWLRGGCSDIGRHQLFGTDAISFLVVYALVCILEVLFDRSKTRTIILAGWPIDSFVIARTATNRGQSAHWLHEICIGEIRCH